MKKTVWLVAFFLALLPLVSSAFFAPVELRVMPQSFLGKVMSRAQVLGDNGGPILVKIRSTGSAGSVETKEVAVIGEVYPGGPLDGVYVLSGGEYSYYLEKYQQLKREKPGQLGRAVFLSPQQLAAGVPLANGEQSEPVNLPESVKTVLVLGREDRFGKDPGRWTLMEVPFLMDEGTELEDNVSSVLLNPNGEVRQTAMGTTEEGGTFDVETFTYRVAYYGRGGNAMKQSEAARDTKDRVFGPVPGQKLNIWEKVKTRSDSEGIYALTYYWPCVGINLGGNFFSVHSTTAPLVLDMVISPYNPIGPVQIPLFVQKTVPLLCATEAKTLHIRDFVVDTLWLTGKVRLANRESGEAIPIGEETRYEAQEYEDERIAQSAFDFDGDGEPDRALLANKIEREDDAGNTYVVPEAAPDGDWQAVYFSSGSKSPDAENVANRVPDVWRLPDRTLPGEDKQHTGLLKQISRDAMISTDLYIFRESTGELIVEVNGLPTGASSKGSLLVDENAYRFNTIMRGPKQFAVEGGLCRNGGRGASCLLNTLYDGSGDSERTLLEDIGEEEARATNEQLGFSSRYRGRDSGMPAPGEQLYAVAINRATGYVGTARFKLGNLSSGEGLESGTITQQVPDITLTPPRLQIWARRLSNIESGLTRGQNVQYLIGHEGAATKDDTIVGIYTRWIGSDGRPFPASIPLPEGLGSGQGEHYGLTGRLNKISAQKLTPATAGRSLDGIEVTLTEEQRKNCALKETAYEEDQCQQAYRLAAAADIAQGEAVTAEFPIAPGQQLQLVQLPDNLTKNQHFYVTVYGRPLSKEAIAKAPYEKTGNHSGLLSGRPNLYTPFYVPRYDEAKTLEEQLERNRQANAEEVTQAGRVPPQYRWMLRPEYQFSLVDLTIEEINAVEQTENPDGSTSENIRNLLDNDVPVVTSGDDLVRIMYELLGPDSDPLPSVDGNREYVFAFGEDEVRATYTEEGELEFENLDHLGQLSTEDYLTARLYLNHDPENYLWEWAFGKNGFHVDFEYPGNEFGLTARKHPDLNTQETGYFILGGSRVRMSFGFPPKSVPLYLEIRSDVPGRTCDDFYSDPASGCTTMTGTNYQILEQTGPSLSPLDLSAWETYWEPINPSGGNDWEVSLDGTLLVKAAYITATGELISYGNVDAQLPNTLPPEIYRVEYPILRQKLWNRTLKPRPASQKAMQGDDVKILEAMLWQLGLSPQWGLGTQGSLGARIDSDRNDGIGALLMTEDCSGQAADDRSVFYAWRSNCSPGQVSLGLMIKRYQARNNNDNYYVASSEIVTQDSIVGPNTLDWLERDWSLYLRSYKQDSRSIISQNNSAAQMAGWLQNGVDVWESGLSQAPVSATYDNTRHTSLMNLMNLSTNDYTRTGLLEAWISKESPYHWGTNRSKKIEDANGNVIRYEAYQETPYRMHEGGADEHGSLSFSQLVYSLRFSNQAVCAAYKGQNDLNHFSPSGQIKTFAIHTSSENTASNNCEGGFHKAFKRDVLGSSYELSPLSDGTSISNLKKVEWQSGQPVEEDDYEKLAKGIMVYNSDKTWFIDKSLPYVLKYFNHAGVNGRNNESAKHCYTCKYSINVRKEWLGEDNLREYIWRGGQDPSTGQDWCFVYGEKEWINPYTVNEAGRPPRPAVFNDYRDRAVLDQNFQVGCT